MSLKRIRVVDLLASDGRVIERADNESAAREALLREEADAFVVYEMLQSEKGGYSGHTKIMSFYTQEDLKDEVERGVLKFQVDGEFLNQNIQDIREIIKKAEE